MSDEKTVLTADAARKLLRGAGIRSTSCRIAVLQHLAASNAPLSHAEVAETLTPEGFDRSTVYRSLTELTDVGLAARLELGDHVWRFEFLPESERVEHPHFMCIDCGKVECLTDVKVSIRSAKSPPHDDRNVTEVLLKGQCADCL